MIKVKRIEQKHTESVLNLKKKASKNGERFSIHVDENILKILLDKLCFDLFELLFNRILSDSNKIGPGCLPALTDSLIHLQQENHVVYSGLLPRCVQKLLYLEVQENMSGILTSEWVYLKNSVIYEETSASDVRYWASCCMKEQLSESKAVSSLYKDKVQAYIIFLEDCEKYCGVDSVIKEVFSMGYLNWRKYVALWVIFKRSLYLDKEFRALVERTRICVVPFSYINTYDLLPFKYMSQFQATEINSDHITKPDQLYKDDSWFTYLASDNSKDNIFRQGDTVLEVMLQYKWKMFIRKRFIGVCLIHLIYYVSYCTGVLFAKEMYGYDSTDVGRSLTADGRHIVSLVILFISWLILLTQEGRQIYKSRSKLAYFSSGYNYVDMLVLIFPLVTFFQMVFNGSYFYEICSTSTLILWLHAILRLRAMSFIGIAVEIIIQLLKRIAPILSVWLLVVLAFTNTFIVLLRQQTDDYFQENFNGTTSVPNGENTENVGITNTYDISSSNGFTDPFKAFYQVWLIIFGVWDPVINGNAGDDRMLFVLCILFALITVLIFTNMIIALMSSTVEDVKKRGKSVWVSHFAAVIAEIEQLWCSSNTKHDRKNNPSYIYYAANVNEVEKHKEMLKRDTERLRKKVFELGDD